MGLVFLTARVVLAFRSPRPVPGRLPLTRPAPPNRITRRGAILILIAIAALAPHGAQAAISEQITIGNTRVVVRTVIGTFEGDLRVLELEDDVYHNELIETEEESATKLIFLDETTLTLGPQSSVVLDRFVFDPDPSKASLVMTATKGIFRFASGKLPKNAYRLHTPAATIGIRGTVLDFSVEPDDGGGPTVVRIALHDGQATVGDCRGQETVLQAGQAIELMWHPAEACAAR